MSLDALVTIEKSVSGIGCRYRGFPCELAMVLRLVRLLGGQINHSGNALLKAWGVTYEEYGVLVTLYGSDGYSMLAMELCHVMGTRAAQVNRVIHALGRRELVVRSYGIVDRRKAVATLTDRGVKLVQEMLPVIDAMVKNRIPLFAPGELAELAQLLTKSVKILT